MVPYRVPVTISTDVAGHGPAVLLLHAGVADSRMWHHQRDVLVTAGYQVVLPDLRGFGRTPAGTRPWDAADDVLEVADTLALDRFALVGASAGGSVALRVATRAPARVTALALLCPAAPDLTPSEELRRLWREEVRLVDAGDLDGASELMVEHFVGPEADDAARELVLTMQHRAYTLQLAAGAAEEADDDTPLDLADVTAPTLAVAGGHDLPDFSATARRVAGEVPHGELVELLWAGHLPSLERPVETSRLVLGHLDRVRGVERLAHWPA
ncbi:Pimeloyl-ACP methyl ester carboxylesterase [Ornithinimicrobium cerasi]|uniref:Pimeloyl-ACP methyl ester carboxylesterase n=1 Tax=Ornithinimicrobium cerasi TaxID=2248773 RepID=A0A285VIM8_9MICO|nr:Pimeloyl-ACP methyl ester carboxylesterase [Ornithinimicrobium cerasi]